ncbi:MAG: hypothetical protein QXJ97_09870, partial [Desulfurococcaceae archaeon]
EILAQNYKERRKKISHIPIKGNCLYSDHLCFSRTLKVYISTQNKSGQKKRRLNLAIDVDLADKLITEASKKYGARGISKFIEELIIDYFERQKAELSKLVENAVK